MLLRIALFFLLALCARGADEVFYLGTYTNGTNSQGIYSGTLDTTTGQLSPLKLAATAKQDPTFITLSPDGKFLFAALNDQIASYSVEADGTLKEISRQPSCGPNTCGLCLNKTGHVLYAASYDGGCFASLPVSAEGHLGPLGHVIAVRRLSGPNKERQERPHHHSVTLDPENHFLYVCDLGADRIWRKSLDQGGGFDGSPLASTICPPGSGPRHLAFSPDGRLVYVANELNVSTSVFARDAATGALTLIKTFPNVAENWPKGAGSAEITVDPSRKWLLVSTRLMDFMTVFRINTEFTWPASTNAPDASPFFQRQLFPSPVQFPRSFAIDPTGHWVIVAGETDNRISVMRFDPASGQLSPTEQFQSVDRPVCVLFAR